MSSELKKASVGTKFLGSLMGFLVFAALLLLFALSARVWHLFSPAEKNLDEKRGEARVAKREALEKDNAAKLTVYAWVNKDKGIVQIPIDRAMQLVVGELNAKPVKPSAVKLENPYPFGLQNIPAAPAASGTAVPAPGVSGTAAPAPAASGTTVPASPRVFIKTGASGTAAPAPATPGATAPH